MELCRESKISERKDAGTNSLGRKLGTWWYKSPDEMVRCWAWDTKFCWSDSERSGRLPFSRNLMKGGVSGSLCCSCATSIWWVLPSCVFRVRELSTGSNIFVIRSKWVSVRQTGKSTISVSSVWVGLGFGLDSCDLDSASARAFFFPEMCTILML